MSRRLPPLTPSSPPESRTTGLSSSSAVGQQLPHPGLYASPPQSAHDPNTPPRDSVATSATSATSVYQWSPHERASSIVGKAIETENALSLPGVDGMAGSIQPVPARPTSHSNLASQLPQAHTRHSPQQRRQHQAGGTLLERSVDTDSKEQDSPSEAESRYFDPIREQWSREPSRYDVPKQTSSTKAFFSPREASFALPSASPGSVASQSPEDRVAAPSTFPFLDRQSRFRLIIRQQPIAARACGHGERDRRVIDPPPILQLTLESYDPDSVEDVALLRSNLNVVHCSLYSVDSPMPGASSGRDVSTIADPHNSGSQSRRLMGSLVTNPFIGEDPDIPASASENARLGCFFLFGDLSCRQIGHYRLHFNLVSINSAVLPAGSASSISASVGSDIFEVYSAKEFPGMRASTMLTRQLRAQGANISVKKGKDGRASGRVKKRGSTASGSGSDDSNDEGEKSHVPIKREQDT